MIALSRALGWFVAPPPERTATSPQESGAGERSDVALRAPADAVFLPPDAGLVTPAGAALAAADDVASAVDVVTSAAVLGRPGEVEPVAAALALALRRESRARAAAVVVVGPAPPGPPDGGDGAAAEAGSGGAAAARRAVARLEAHGFEARVRGRLAWTWLDPRDTQFVSAARRVTLIAAPAVLAIIAARTFALDQALAEQDLLLVVTSDPDGPLARLVASGLPPVPVMPVRPLTRGPSRALARAGIRAPRAFRPLVGPAPERQR